MTKTNQENNWKKNIAYLLTAQAVSTIGTMLVQYAIIWHVTISTKSGTMVGIMSSIGILPMVVVMPFAGVLADRWNRKNMAMIADGFVAMVSLSLAILLWTEQRMESNILLLLGTMFLRSIGQGMQTPALSSIIPQITPKEQLVRINSIDQTIQAFMLLASPALAAVVLNSFSLAAVLLIDFATAAIGIAGMLYGVSVPFQKQAEPSKHSVLSDLKEGSRYLRSHKVILALIVVGFIGSMLASPVSNLAPLQITRKFSDGLWRLSASEIGFASGMILGGIGMSIWGSSRNKLRFIAMGYGLLILPFIVLGMTTHFWLFLCMMVTIGFVIPISRTSMIAMLQERTDEQHMGRVMSIVTTVISVASPLTMMVVGPLADQVSLDIILVSSGVLLVPLVMWLYFGKVFRG
jgi:DHA3 family macrolide efflux protein-like MFS transporter